MVVCIDPYCRHTAGCLVQYFQHLSSFRVDNAKVIQWCTWLVAKAVPCAYPYVGHEQLQQNGCVFGDVSTGVDVEGPATERGTRCSVGNATGRVSLWLGSGVCDAAHTAYRAREVYYLQFITGYRIGSITFSFVRIGHNQLITGG